MREAKKILKEMIIGVFIWSLPVLVMLAFIAENKPAAVCGVLAGAFAAAGIIYHMYKHLDIALYNGGSSYGVDDMVQLCASYRCCIRAYGCEDDCLYAAVCAPFYCQCQKSGMRTDI